MKWEYRIEFVNKIQFDNRNVTLINQLGKEGWELFHVDDPKFRGATETEAIRLIFKRPKK